MGERSYSKGATVSSGDITVHQLVTEEEFGVPSVVLKLVSNRRDPARIRLEVPDVNAERVGFHPEYEKDSWTIEDDTLIFETELEPQTELTTLYAVDTDEPAQLEDSLDRLEITTVDPIGVDPDEEPVPTEEPATVEASANEAEEFEFGTDPDETLIDPEDDIAGAEAAGDAALTQEAVEFDQLSEQPPDEPSPPANSDPVEPESEDGSSSAAPADEAGPPTATPDEAPAADPDPTTLSATELIDELLDRLAEGDLPASQRRKLEQAIGDEDGREDIMEAQISHLQSRMSNIETFSESIEEVYERQGPPADLFEEFDQRLARLESEVASMAEDVSEATAQMDGVQPRVESIEAAVDEVADDLEDVQEDVSDVQRDQESMDAELRELKTWRQKVTGALEAFMGE